jgi:hypothetical protein
MQFNYTFRILAIITCAAMLAACTKENKCRDGFTPAITVNSPVLGDTLRLSVEEVEDAYMYRWHGPNSFVSEEREAIVPRATALHSGRYTVDIVTESGCIYTATTDSVVVKDAQDISCDLNINTAALGDTMSFFDVEGAQIDEIYYLNGDAAPGGVRLQFNTAGAGLTSGVYTTAPARTLFGPGYVSVRLLWYSLEEWMADSGNKVYVSVSGGRVTVTFCNMPFHTADGQTAAKGSVYMVYP